MTDTARPRVISRLGVLSAISFAVSILIAQTPTLSAQTELSSDAETPAAGSPDFGPIVELLYDNGVSNFTTSIASQDSDTFFARTADDFSLDGATLGCGSGRFDVAQILVMVVQEDATPQPFGLEIYADGDGAPIPQNAVSPIARFAETSQIDLGRFGLTTSLFQVTFDTEGLSLRADVTYWLSAFGTDDTSNTEAFNNFFAVSNGAPGTLDNGVVIAPSADVMVWTRIEDVLGPPARAFSFAVAGSCGAPVTLEVPALSARHLLIFAAALALVGATTMRKLRAS